MAEPLWTNEVEVQEDAVEEPLTIPNVGTEEDGTTDETEDKVKDGRLVVWVVELDREVEDAGDETVGLDVTFTVNKNKNNFCLTDASIP